jgi:hypothetical protein
VQGMEYNGGRESGGKISETTQWYLERNW